MRCLSRRTLKELRSFLEPYASVEAERLVRALDRVLFSPSRAVRTKKRYALPSPVYAKYAARKKKSRRVQTSAIRAACLKRADGACEHCGKAFTAYDPATMDHFEGGSDKRAQESVEGCWMLRLGCHRAKSAETPSRMFWLEAFAVHCRRYDYPHERIRAQMARIWAGLAGGGV